MTASPGPPPSPSPTPSSSPSGPAAGPLGVLSRKGRTPLYVGAAVVVVIVILLLVLVLPSVLGPGSSSGGSSKGLTYDQARPIADSAVANYQGGGWVILFASGYSVNSSYSVPVNQTSATYSGTQCTFTPAPGVSGNITIPGITANLTSGETSAWVFAFRNGAGDLALVGVVGGQGQGIVLGTLSGSTCTSIFGLLSMVPGNVIDSPQAAAAVSAASSAFRTAHPNASALFALIGGLSFFGRTVGPEWTVEYTTCTPTTPNGTPGSTFNATVNALNGTVISYQTTASVVCSGSSSSSGTPLSSALSVVPVSGFSSGSTHLYNLTVTSASHGVTWQDTTPEITSAGGNPIGGGTVWNLTVTDLSGTPIAVYDPSTATWSASPNLLISSGEGVIVSSNYSLTSDYLVLQGNGAFTGSVTVSV